MKKTLTRFEFVDEINGMHHVGILTGLDFMFEGEFRNDLSMAWEHLNDELPVPTCDFKKQPTISYFTEEGIGRFGKYIQTILMQSLIECIDTTRIEIQYEPNNPDILYEDPWQVVFLRHETE